MLSKKAILQKFRTKIRIVICKESPGTVFPFSNDIKRNTCQHWSTSPESAWIFLPSSKVLDLSHQKDCCNACSTTSTAYGFCWRNLPVSLVKMEF